MPYCTNRKYNTILILQRKYSSKRRKYIELQVSLKLSPYSPVTYWFDVKVWAKSATWRYKFPSKNNIHVSRCMFLISHYILINKQIKQGITNKIGFNEIMTQ